MKKLLFLLSVLFTTGAFAQLNHVVISQVYGGGGNSGATYTHDFIELFNPTANDISLDGWSVQYASSTGTSWARTSLSGTIPAYGYYLVQEAQGSGGTTPLPTPDATGTIALAAVAGKVALVNNNTALTGGCPTGVVDFVGFGTTASCYEGAGPTPAPSNSNAILRKNGGCTDTENNSADFEAGAPSPRNSGSPVNTLCGGTATTPSLSINSIYAAEGDAGTTDFTFVVTLSAPAPAGGVRFDIATADGTATAGSDYTAKTLTGQTIAEGETTYSFTVSVNGDTEVESDETFYVSLTNATGANIANEQGTGTGTIVNDDVNAGPAPNIVINQVYGGGGNAGATYKNDFIELYNNEDHAVNLAGWSVQYASAAGSSWQVTPLTGTLPPKGFYLVQEASGNGGTVDLPAPDATGGIPMGAASFKVALSNSTTALSGTNPSGDAVIDFVGVGTANAYETAAAPAASNTTSVKRMTDGMDTDDNSADFTATFPDPRNAAFTTTPPVVVSATPSNGRTDVPYNSTLSLTFNKNLETGSGNISIYKNGSLDVTLPVNSGDVTISGKTATINYALSPAASYYILVTPGALKDVYNNEFAGFTTSTEWTFQTWDAARALTIPLSVDFNTCDGSGFLPNGFTQFSESGSIVWDCTGFGHDINDVEGKVSAPNGIQISGFANGANQPNKDWLISPAIDLTGTDYPLFSFWSRTAFIGSSLQLMVSTDYAGTGDPRLARWTEINGKFPAEGSNVWTLSSGINLARFKAERVFLAFVYTSTDEDGPRWTIDDLGLENAAAPPPPTITPDATDLNFPYTAAGDFSNKMLTFIANDLTGNLTVSASDNFLLSVNGEDFVSQRSFTPAEISDLFQNLQVRFAPSLQNKNYSGTLTFSTGDLTATVTLHGTSIDPATTLEVVNWNMEWFGSPDLGPTDDDRQQRNAETVLKTLDADVYALVEVVDEQRLAAVVNRLNEAQGAGTYTYTISHYGSHVNPPEAGGGPLSEAQKEAFVYKTALFSNVSTRPLINLPPGTESYYNWSSGRYPYLMTADVQLNGQTQTLNFVLVHAKANTSPVLVAYDRRQAAAQELYDTLQSNFATEKVIILGDLNDDLDQTITAGINPPVTSYSMFTADTENYYSPTLALSLAGKKSTVSYNDIIDHVILSSEMEQYYLPASAAIMTDVASLISSYGSTTSDHYPVLTRYQFCHLSLPSNITVSTDAGACGAVVNFEIPVTYTCGTVSSTSASGDFFPVGTTTVSVTTESGEDGSFTVLVSDTEKPLLITPVVPVLCYNRAGEYAIPVLAATDNCGVARFSYSITGATNRTGSGNDASGAFNTGASTILWSVTDVHGNTATATTAVVVNTPVAADIPEVYAFTGAAANTLYTGYGPSAITLQGLAAGGSGSYSYKWTVGTSAGQGLSNEAAFTVSPSATTTYVFNARDQYGCAATYATITVTVTDVRCGSKMDGVLVCQQNKKGAWTTSCVAEKEVAKILSAGGSLGSCVHGATTRMVPERSAASPLLQLLASPNPTAGAFRLQVSSESSAPVQLRVIDLLGRTVETKTNLQAQSVITIGGNYLPGVYLAEVSQGEQKTSVKLVKQ